MDATGSARLEYVERAAALPKDAKEARSALKAEYRQGRQTSLFQSITKQVDKSRASSGHVQRFNNAAKTNPSFERGARIMRGAGRAMTAVAVAVEGYSVATAAPEDRLQVATQATGRLGGGLAGAYLGAKICVLAGPYGVVAGAFIGGVGGAIAGEAFVDWLAGW